jgi:hypothetical protein
MTRLSPISSVADRAAGPPTLEDTGEGGRLSRSGIDHDGWLSKGELLTMRRNRHGGAGG